MDRVDITLQYHLDDYWGDMISHEGTAAAS